MMSLLSGDCVSHNQKKRESTSSNASSYLLLLNSLANDLDCMLNELCSPADDYQRSDVFLEPYLQQHGTVSEVDGSPDTPPPNPLMQHQLAHLHHVQSSESLSSEGESSAHGTSAAESSASHSDSGSEVACDITLIERLIRSHPIWFLPGIQRAGAFHLLQGKEEGNFVVRQSSQSDTMALSVRLPAGKGPYIEHYLIQANKGKLSLETSDNRFDNIPSLIAHYSQCCDELPVQLTLPRAMREAKNRQQLSSLALLGQEFWRYPMANPKPPESGGSSSNASSLGSFNTGNDPIAHDDNNIISSRDKSIILNLIPITSQDSSHSIKSVTTSTFVTSQQPRLPRPTPPNTLNLKRFNEPLDEKNERIEDSILPCEKPSQKLISPNLVQSIRCRSPVVHNVESNVLIPTESKLNNESQNLIKNINSNSPNLTNANSPNSQSGDITRNIIFESQESAGVIQINNIKTPPTPPPRWAKPGASQCQNSNVTVTTTTTVISLNVNQIGNGTGDSFQQVVTSSDKSVTMLSPQSITSNKSFSSNFTSRSTLSPSTPTLLSPSSKLVSNGRKTPNLLSPTTPSSTNKSRRRRDREARKNSQHYQESDILESYCRSSPADKISDYEDIWNTTDRSNSSWSPHDRSENTLSPSQPSENLIKDPFAGTDRVMLLRNDRSSRSREKLSYMEIASPEFSSFKPIAESCSKSPRGSTSPEDIGGIPKRPDLLSRVCSANSLNSPNVTAITPVKNKLALMFTKSESNSPMTPESKQSSPFYAEPADAIQQIQPLVPRRKNRNNSGITSKYRHSEPGWFQMPGGNNPHQMHPIDWTESEEIEDKIPLISSSVDNLTSNRLGGKENKKIYPRAKPVQPPKVKPKISNDTSWTVDSSWEFIGNEGDDTGGSEAERRGGENENEDDKKDKYSSESDRSQGKHKSPKLNGNGNRHGSDNKSDVIKTENETDFEDSPEFMSDILLRQFPRDSYNKDDGTNSLTVQSIIFQRYPELIKTTNATDTLQSNYNNSTLSNIEKRKIRETTPSDWEADRTYEPSEWETNVDTDDSDHERLKRKASFKERLDPLLSPPRLQALKNRDASGTGSSIRAYALLLAADKTTVFSQNIDNFIQCTMEGKEASPHVVMRNIRQFMSGMKNYLVKHGEREFEKEVEKERLKLKANEFLNLDAILEGVMMRLVVRPLREHVYKLFVEHYGATGSLNTLADSIQYAHGKHIQELGVRATIIPPSDNNLNLILKYIERLQKSDSPLDKLENLLSAISTIFNSVKHSNCDKHVTLGADDLLPLLVWVLVRGKVVDAEIEAEFMWGLLHPSLLTGEGGYYLTTLSSAVHVLKTFKTSQGTMSTTNGCGTPECCSSVLRVLVPDEIHGSLNTRTLPVRPNMNTREICRILAHKTRCTNPQDYGLYKLVQGEETLLGDHECPQELSHCLFAFKRIDAKIAWPKTTS
ncbi:protein sprint isoform X2 [Microplitis mediator]|uniref:protein sprint isoform X2 n=1 Tax=Microplitis mediator TaxID=375433 RepID=UPI00255598B4|nr:protein sprint isoform X2 [Microplitis mediator]